MEFAYELDLKWTSDEGPRHLIMMIGFEIVAARALVTHSTTSLVILLVCAVSRLHCEMGSRECVWKALKRAESRALVWVMKAVDQGCAS